MRLLDAHDYRRVFAQPARSTDELLTVLGRPNGRAHARLGLAISRKSATSAVQRNRIKRLVRESFRRHLRELPSVDFVVLARTGVAAKTNEEIRRSLERHWRRLTEKCVKS